MTVSRHFETAHQCEGGMQFLDFLVHLALQEDIGRGDVTTETVVDPSREGEASVFGREPFIVSGSRVFQKVFRFVDPHVRVSSFCSDGDYVEKNKEVFTIRGRLQSLLKAERTALNFLQRLCGIATLTGKMCAAVAGTSCRILDTRKTTPLWRDLEKEAVRHGGGTNHRFGLYDGVLIKDNHIKASGSIGEAIRRARSSAPHTLKIEVEVENLEELEEAIEAGADIVMLDNFSIDDIRRAVEQARGRCLLEVSGGVSLETVGEIAKTGVNFISCGALTHSARSIDLSMEITQVGTYLKL